MIARTPLALALLLCVPACAGKKATPACVDGKPAVARIGACDVPRASLRYAVMLSPGPEAKPRALHALVERESLAQAAAAAGDAAPAAGEVQRRMAAGEAWFLGTRVTAPPWIEEGAFSHRRLEAWVGSLGLSVDELVAEQRRELLAQRMRDRLGDPPAVEAWLTQRCEELRARGQITVVPEVADGFQPCAPPPVPFDPALVKPE